MAVIGLNHEDYLRRSSVRNARLIRTEFPEPIFACLPDLSWLLASKYYPFIEAILSGGYFYQLLAETRILCNALETIRKSNGNKILVAVLQTVCKLSKNLRSRSTAITNL